MFCSCCIIGNIIFTARNSNCGKVMFSQAYVIPSAHGGGLPGGRVCLGGLPRGVRIQGASASGDPHRAGVGQPPPPIGDYGIRSTSGRYASYWNAFLWYVRFVFYLPSYDCSEVQPRHSAPLEEVVTSCKKHGVCLKGIISTPMTYEGTLLETVNMQLRLDPETIISFLIKLTNFISQS